MDKVFAANRDTQKTKGGNLNRAAVRLHPLYTVVSELDRDPAGILYSAVYEAEALKVLVKAVAVGVEEDVDAFEAPPPDCLTVLDRVTSVEGRPLVVLEAPKGNSLKRVLDRQGKMSLRPAVSLMRKLLSTLALLHEQGRSFGTLSSGSVFVSRMTGGKLRLQLAYFGLKTDGRSLCHIEYRPPEWGFPGRLPNAVDDLFAAAVVFYEMLFGVMPFHTSGERQASEHAGVDTDPLYLPPSFESEHPVEAAMLRRALNVKSAERYRSAKDMLDALQSTASESSQPFLPAPPQEARARSSIPTVPSPPRDSLITEAKASNDDMSNDDITKPYSIPTIEPYQTRRSDPGTVRRGGMLKLIAVGVVAMLLPVAIWAAVGGKLPFLTTDSAEVSSPASSSGSGDVASAVRAETAGVLKDDVVHSKTVEETSVRRPSDTAGDDVATSGVYETSSPKKHLHKKKHNDVIIEKRGPEDDLSSNPFPLKNNPFPQGTTQ